ncbi:MAG: hypothetical protein ABL931_01590 [Usitatibacteraceae bacterium]
MRATHVASPRFNPLSFAFINVPRPDLALDAVTTRAFSQRERDSAVTKTAFFATQDHGHVYFCRPCNALEEFVVATATIKPGRVGSMREPHHRHLAGIFKNYLGIAGGNLDTDEDMRTGFDMALLQRFYPTYLVADCVGREHP